MLSPTNKDYIRPTKQLIFYAKIKSHLGFYSCIICNNIHLIFVGVFRVLFYSISFKEGVSLVLLCHEVKFTDIQGKLKKGGLRLNWFILSKKQPKRSSPQNVIIMVSSIPSSSAFSLLISSRNKLLYVS